MRCLSKLSLSITSFSITLLLVTDAQESSVSSAQELSDIFTMAAPSSAPQGAPLSNPVLPYPYPPGAERPLRDIENRLRGQRVLLAGIVDIFAGWPTGSHPAREGVVQSYNQEKWQYVHQEVIGESMLTLNAGSCRRRR